MHNCVPIKTVVFLGLYKNDSMRYKNFIQLIATLCIVIVFLNGYGQNKIVVFQSDFGLKDGAVSEMKGIAMGVDKGLQLFDVTHEIPAYNIWEAAYRLQQTVPYWPKGTVFVSVVDPGVGTDRKSVVVKTKTGHFIVTPDNGTLTLIAENLGIEERREIDETINRRNGSQQSYTFHGRDVYAYTAARLAAGIITYEQIGKKLAVDSIVKISYQKPVFEKNTLKGNIAILDIQYGNIWTNISADLFKQLHVQFGDQLRVVIFKNNVKVVELIAPYEQTFGAVAKGKPLAYLNSLMQLSFALNQNSFANKYHIASGNNWSVTVSKVN